MEYAVGGCKLLKEYILPANVLDMKTIVCGMKGTTNDKESKKPMRSTGLPIIIADTRAKLATKVSRKLLNKEGILHNVLIFN